MSSFFLPVFSLTTQAALHLSVFAEDIAMAEWGGLGESNERDDSSPNKRVPNKDSSGSSSSSAWHIATSPTKIPRGADDISVLPSAPVDIPDWSKIYGMNGNKKVSRDAVREGLSHKGTDSGDDEDEDDKIPPHEWIARKLARSQISSFSVCEGIGRKLKGRYLSKVRNSILTKTGFIE